MRSLALKTAVVAAAFATTGAFGAETGLPFEQTEFDRQLPAIHIQVSSGSYVADSSAPFEQTQFDRTLPNVPERTVASSESVLVARSHQGSPARATDASQASGGASAVAARSPFATGVWANDHNFIAPPQ
jgi:hypothetical protein